MKVILNAVQNIIFEKTLQLRRYAM